MRLTPEQVVGMALRNAGLDNIGMKVPAVAEAIFDALDHNGYEITNKPRRIPGKPVAVGKRTNPLKIAQQIAGRAVRTGKPVPVVQDFAGNMATAIATVLSSHAADVERTQEDLIDLIKHTIAKELD